MVKELGLDGLPRCLTAPMVGLVEKPHVNNVPTPSFDAPDGVYCTGDKSRTVDNYYSLQDQLGVVIFDEGISTNNGEGGDM